MEQRYIKVGLALTVGLLAGLWSVNNVLGYGARSGRLCAKPGDPIGLNGSHRPTHQKPICGCGGLARNHRDRSNRGIARSAGSMAHVVAEECGSCRFRDRKAACGPRRWDRGVELVHGFLVIGGTAIMMGQAEGMKGAIRGATTMATLSFLTLIYLSMAEPARGDD